MVAPGLPPGRGRDWYRQSQDRTVSPGCGARLIGARDEARGQQAPQDLTADGPAGQLWAACGRPTAAAGSAPPW
jgi:hypothetical protein